MAAEAEGLLPLHWNGRSGCDNDVDTEEMGLRRSNLRGRAETRAFGGGEDVGLAVGREAAREVAAMGLGVKRRVWGWCGEKTKSGDKKGCGAQRTGRLDR